MARTEASPVSSPLRSEGASAGGGVLALALARGGFGETTLGLRIADELRAAGMPVQFLIHPALSRVFEGGAHPFERLADERDETLDARLDGLVRRGRPAAILLVDLLTTITELLRRRAGPRVLSRFDLPIVALDPWNLPEIEGQLDFAPGAPLTVAEAATHHPLRLVPVPFARPEAPGAVELLPRIAPLTPEARAAERAALGVSPGQRLVFLATAGWQQRRYGDPGVDRLVDGVPRLVGAYLAALGPDVRVLHVGPAPLPFDVLGERSLHRDQLSPDRFLAGLGAADLVLSLNAPATTSTAALALGVPILTLQNSFVGESLDALWSWLGRRPDPTVVAWARAHAPMHRFLMWPMSAWGMLSRVLADNPYDALLHRVELLDAERVLETARRLLSEGQDEAIRSAYLARVRSLPGPAERMRSNLA